MKRYLHCSTSNAKNLFNDKKRWAVCSLMLSAVFSVFSLSAKSIFTDNQTTKHFCSSGIVAESEQSVRYESPAFFAFTPDQISVSAVTAGNPTNCITPNGDIIISAEGSNTSLALEYSIDGGTTFQLSNFFGDLAASSYNIVVRYEDDTCPVVHGDVVLTTASAPVIQTVNANNVTACDVNNGALFIDATGSGALEFSIDNGVNYVFNGFFSGLSAGDYTILVRSAGTDCVSNPELISITAPISPVFESAILTDLTGCSASDGMISITASGGTNGNFEYTVDGGSSWQGNATFMGLGAGTYTPGVRNADDDTCPDLGSLVTLTAPDSPQLTAPTVFEPSSCLASDGVITVNFTNGDVNTLDFSIDNGVTWQINNNTFNGLAGGNYQIRVRTTDQTCFVSGATIKLPGGTEPNIVGDFTQEVSDCGGADGIITLIVDNDDGSFQYSIDNGATFQNSNAFTGLPAGSYPVVVTAAGGSCAVNGQTYVLSEPAAPIITDVAVNQSTTCDGSDATIVISVIDGQGQYAYSIDNGANFSLNNTFGQVMAGSYSIVVSNANGTCPVTHSGSISVNELTSPEISAINAIPATNCNADDGSISVTAQGGTGIYEYSIDNGVTWQLSNTFTGLSAGDYLLGIRNSDGTCPLLENAAELLGSGSATINNIASTNPTDCGLEDGTISVDVTGANTYEYSIDGVNFQASNTFSGLSEGTYAVTIRIADGSCPTSTNPIVLTSAGGTITDVTQTNPTSCDNNDGTITISATGDDLVYSLDGLSFQVTGLFENLSAGTYQPIVQNTDGTCIIERAEITLISSEQPASPTFFTENPTGCTTGNGLITILVSNDTGAFLYSIDGGLTFQNSNSFTGLSGGEYNIIITSVECETNGGAVSLIEPTEPIIGAIDMQNPTACDTNNGSITVSGTGEGELEYSINAGLTWQSFGTFNGLDAGVYTPSIRNQMMGSCPVLGNPVTLTTADQATIADVAVINPAGCDSSNGTITITAAGAATNFLYSIDGGVNFQADNTFTNLTIGTYNVQVSNADGSCVSASEFTQLTAPGAPVVEEPLATQPTDCGTNDGIIVITADGGTGNFQYSIDGGNTYVSNNAFTTLASGTYNVFVRNSDGTCAVEAGIVNLNSTNSPNVSSLFSQGTTDCTGTADGLITVLASNDDGTFEYSIDGGTTFQGSNQFTGLAVGTYNVVVRRANSDCQSDGGSVTITAPESPQLISVAEFASDCGGATGSIIIEAEGGLPAYEFTIDGGTTWAVGNNFGELAAGTYVPGVRNAGGDCATIGDAITVTEDTTPTFNGAEFTQPTGPTTTDATITVNAVACGSNTLEYSIDGGLTWQTGNFFDNLPPGTYEVEVRNVGSTDFVGDFEVVITAPDGQVCAEITSVSQANPTTATANDGTITINISNDTGITQYSIDGGATFSATNTFSNLGEGTYTPFIQNTDGTCQVTADAITLTADDNGGGGTTELTLTSTNPTACEADNGTITITAPTGAGWTYTINGTDFQVSPEFSGLTAGGYAVSALNSATNTTATFGNEPLFLTAPGVPEGTTAFTNPGCGTEDGTISISGNGGNGSSYEYSIDNSATWSTENTFAGLAAGNYSPIIRNGDGTCMFVLDAITLMQTGTITVSEINVTDIGCGQIFGSLTINANGGNGSLEYSIDGGTTWQASSSFADLAAGDYNIAVRNADGTCETAGGQASISNSTELTISNIEVTPISCGETTGSLTITATGGENLLYSIDGGANFSPFNTFNDLPVGTYTITVQDSEGVCIAQGGEVMIENAAGEPVAITGVFINDPSGCSTPDGEITVDVDNVNQIEFSIDGGLNYQASNIFTGLAEGTYTVFARNNDGSCASTYALNPVNLVNDDQLLFVETMITVNVEDLLPGGKVCVPADIGQLVAYNLFINGAAYEEPLAGCDNVELTAYGYGSLVMTSDGPYMVNEWVCNGQNFSGQVNDIVDLRNQMNIWDPTGNWNIINGLTILGGATGVTYGDIDITVVSNGQSIGLDANTAGLPTGTCIVVGGEGTYVLDASNDEGCTDVITIVVEGDGVVNPPIESGSEGDTILISTVINTNADEYCFTGENLPTGPITGINTCDDGSIGNVILNGGEFCATYVPQINFLGVDEFCVVICEPGNANGIICDTTIFIVTVHPPTDTIDLEVSTLETLEYCAESPVLTLPGNLTSGTLCSIDETQTAATIVDNCITFDPVDGFIGLTEICIVFCDDSTPDVICDTTYFNLNVTEDCEPIFAESEITVLETQPTTDICLPIPQLILISDYQIMIDGALLATVPAPCDVDTVYNYAYNAITTGEPVTIDEWVCNGQTFSYELLDVMDLVDSMQVSDPAGNWTLDADNLIISGGVSGGGYGDMSVTLSDGTLTTIFGGFTFLANGGSVTLNDYGTHTITLTNVNGCVDVLTVNLEEDIAAQTIFVSTPFETMIEELCGDTLDLPGNWNGDVGYCQTPTDGTSPFLSGLPCASYTPLSGFVGLDTLCLTMCDDSPVAVCEETTFVISVLPPVDTIMIDAPSIMAFDTCLMTADFLQLPGNVISADICGFNADEVSVSIQDTCLTIDLAGDFGLNTTEICIVHCDDTNPSFCDTTYIFVTNTLECEEIFISTDTTLVTDMGVSNLCLPILPVDIIMNYTVELDGEIFTGPSGGCDFTDAFVYQTNTFPEAPFTMVIWEVDGMMFESTADDIAGVLALMNEWDPTGNWMFDEIGNSIFGGEMDTIYGNLFVTDGAIISNDPPAPQEIPGGTQFVFTEPGAHVFVLTNNETGCSDQININVIDGSETIFIETFQNEPDTTCFNITADYPNFDSISICGQPTNGTFEILDDTCFIFIPNMDYLGEDEGCITVCSTIDEVVACDTFAVLINVIPNCEDNLIIEDNVVLMADDCEEIVNYCLPTNGADLTGYIVTDNGTEVDITNACGGEVTGGFYDFSEIPGLLAFGEFNVDSVLINDVLFSGTFNSAAALGDSLNIWDGAGGWTTDFITSRFNNTTTTITYDTLFISGSEGQTFVLPYNIETSTDGGFSLDLTTGTHQIVFTDPISGCTDVVNVNVMCEEMMGCPELTAETPAEIIMDDCNLPVSYCLNIPVDSLINYTITDNGAPYGGGAIDCPDAPGTAALQLLEGEHTLVFTRNDGTCMEEFFVDVRCIQFIDLEIDTTINLGQSEIICLYEDLDVDTTGIISMINNCPVNEFDNVTFTFDLETFCITLDPLNIGLDTLCLQVCNEVECINIGINVTVLEQCDDLFALDNIGAGILDCAATEGDICLPILMEDLAGTDIFVNGEAYTGERSACDIDSIYSINLSDVPGGGQIGPYGVFFNITDENGITTTVADTVDVIEEALALLNMGDPTNTWIFREFPPAFVGGSATNDYTLTVIQNNTQEEVNLGVNSSLRPNGTAISVPFGTSEVVFLDQETGCRDTLVSTVACVSTDTLFLTLDVGMLDTLCFDTLDLPGNFATITNDCPQQSGINTEVIVIGNTAEQGDSLCVSFAGLTPGDEQACIVLCDDLGICDTTYVFITVNDGNLILPVALPDSTVTGINQPVVLNPFANDTINGILDTFYIVTQPNFGEAAFSPDGTINYVPNDGYCDPSMPDSLQYALCNTVGCDTAWVSVTVNCEGIEIFTGVSPNGDGVNDNFTIQGVEAFEESRLQIFNRWGNRVHDVINYQNDWGGTWDGKDLPDGTYFYLLNLNDEEEQVFSGYLQIHR